jgi:hypothetical protein
MKAIVAALGLAIAAATAIAATPSVAAPFAATASHSSAVAEGIQHAGGYVYGRPHYGRPYPGRPYWGPRPVYPGYGYYPRPRTRVVQRPCSTRVVQRTPYGRYVTVYQTCGRGW